MTTSISSTSPSTRRAPGTFERMVLTVPDPAATAEFLRSGLEMQVLEKDGRLLAVCDGEYRNGRGQGAIELSAGGELAVDRIVFALPEDTDLEELRSLLAGTRVSDTAVDVTDPAGDLTVRLELTSALRVDAPDPSVLRPRRMGHVNLKSPKPAATASFFTEVLGLKLSEYIGEDLFWMRTDTEHHNVALRPGAHGTVHHIGLEIGGWHAYEPILDHLDHRGFKAEYGPGRHRPGRSLFTYVCDPSSGLRIELFADMVHLPDPSAPPLGWEPGDRMTKTLNTWGPLPPESFLA
ncbi:VOC family protein [Amycolatopsis rhabdoformis]|uniref:VOC family protein n=1 Tax=Amycolatopsis rhabdoformis TaxID=1448059 RepID=A0ABZ1IJF1_9PSEU|nr:VOC family protein [Amycolatopsis rhabdoformis]WSE33550.1 VOC family protein [Amycolatopsis rhabdoformis]